MHKILPVAINKTQLRKKNVSVQIVSRNALIIIAHKNFKAPDGCLTHLSCLDAFDYEFNPV